jgi:hypothetical protein
LAPDEAGGAVMLSETTVGWVRTIVAGGTAAVAAMMQFVADHLGSSAGTACARDS